MFAAHHRLANLVPSWTSTASRRLVTRTRSCRCGRWPSGGRRVRVDVHEVDGHNPAALQATIAGLDTTAGPPHVLIARTVFGKGVSYMEGQIKWHYWPMSDAEYRQAMQEIEAMP